MLFTCSDINQSRRHMTYHQLITVNLIYIIYYSLEKKVENILLEITDKDAYGKKKLYKTQNVNELPLKQASSR
jgi:hypothetical protein